jgi:hypothetical protein
MYSASDECAPIGGGFAVGFCDLGSDNPSCELEYTPLGVGLSKSEPGANDGWVQLLAVQDIPTTGAIVYMTGDFNWIGLNETDPDDLKPCQNLAVYIDIIAFSQCDDRFLDGPEGPETVLSPVYDYVTALQFSSVDESLYLAGKPRTPGGAVPDPGEEEEVSELWIFDPPQAGSKGSWRAAIDDSGLPAVVPGRVDALTVYVQDRDSETVIFIAGNFEGKVMRWTKARGLEPLPGMDNLRGAVNSLVYFPFEPSRPVEKNASTPGFFIAIVSAAAVGGVLVLAGAGYLYKRRYDAEARLAKRLRMWSAEYDTSVDATQRQSLLSRVSRGSKSTMETFSEREMNAGGGTALADGIWFWCPTVLTFLY